MYIIIETIVSCEYRDFVELRGRGWLSIYLWELIWTAVPGIEPRLLGDIGVARIFSSWCTFIPQKVDDPNTPKLPN